MSKLLRSSPVRTNRLHRLAFVMIGLGMSLLTIAIMLRYQQNVQIATEQKDYLQRVFFNPFGSPNLVPPFLTARGADVVYAPGQTALAFADGFQPHEPIFARLYSRTRGLLDAYLTQADVRGQFIAARSLSLIKEQKNYTPPGGLWFQVEALSGREQTFHFRLEPDMERQAIATKGVYPLTAVPDSAIVFWCSGLQIGEDPIIKVVIDGQEFHAGKIKTYPVVSDGLLLGTLTVSPDDPTGSWQLFASQCQFDFDVRSIVDPETTRQGAPHVDHSS